MYNIFILLILGMTSATNGTVIINGKNINNQSSKVIKEIGLCPQHDMLFPQLSVSQQIEFFARVSKLD